MAYLSLLWKARTIERYRLNYEHEKLKSLMMSKAVMPKKSLYQKWQHYNYDTKKRIQKTCRRWCPEGSPLSNLFVYLKTDQTFPNFLIKSIVGFVGGIILTYLCFMFFVFQLSISLIHATIMSCIIGVLLTLGLAFSYRVRCLVFLLIPQFFSRVGRYTLTCYALVLILTGPATNTLKNSEVLSESMACSQEQIKTSVQQITDSIRKPFNLMKDTIKLMIERIKQVTSRIRKSFLKINRLVLSITRVIESGSSWLGSVGTMCNKKLGTPYEHCTRALEDGVVDCRASFGPQFAWLCNKDYVTQAVCWNLKPLKMICVLVEFVNDMITVSVKNRLEKFSDHIKSMLHVEVHTHRSFSFSSNSSHSASQVAAGIVTEIRNRADPILTWLSWSSCVTSLFLLLIIFRAKYYQHMFETRSRFDNRYITKEIRDLDFKRQRQGRKTILPLNKREKTKYISTTSFRLVVSEKVSLSRSMVLMTITTFKLLIHMAADYSLYWILMTIRYHGRFQSTLHPGEPDAGIKVLGSGPVAMILKSLIKTLSIPIATPAPSPLPCLPNPYPPDFRRYTQIGVLIFLLWFFAMFEPYGLRLRHVVMGLYRPERARARAVWLFNHILRTRAGFMKHARRKLHREFKYSTEKKLTYNAWLETHVTCWLLRYLFGIGPKEPQCLLCCTNDNSMDPDTELIRCESPECPGVYCTRCFSDIGQLCTICLSPADYGDLSDVSLEKGSSEDNEDSDLEHGSNSHYLQTISLTSQGTSKLEDINTTNLQPTSKAKNDHIRSILKNKYTKGNQKETSYDSTIIYKTSNKENVNKEEMGLYKKATIIRQKKLIYDRDKNLIHIKNNNKFKQPLSYYYNSNNVNLCSVNPIYFSKYVMHKAEELLQNNHDVEKDRIDRAHILKKNYKKCINDISKPTRYYFETICEGKNKTENKLIMVSQVMRMSNVPNYNIRFYKINVKNKTQITIVIYLNCQKFSKQETKPCHRRKCYDSSNKVYFETKIWNKTIRPQRSEKYCKVTMWEKNKRASVHYLRFWMLPEHARKVPIHKSGKGLVTNKNNHRLWSLTDTGFDDRFFVPNANDVKNVEVGSFCSKKHLKGNIRKKKMNNLKVDEVGKNKFTSNYCYSVVENISVNNDKKIRQYWDNFKRNITSQSIFISKEKTIVQSNKKNYKRRKKVNTSSDADDCPISERNRKAENLTLSAFLEHRSWFKIKNYRSSTDELGNKLKHKKNVRGVRKKTNEVQERKESLNSEECAVFKTEHDFNLGEYNNTEEKLNKYQNRSVNSKY